MNLRYFLALLVIMTLVACAPKMPKQFVPGDLVTVVLTGQPGTVVGVYHTNGDRWHYRVRIANEKIVSKIPRHIIGSGGEAEQRTYTYQKQTFEAYELTERED